MWCDCADSLSCAVSQCLMFHVKQCELSLYAGRVNYGEVLQRQGGATLEIAFLGESVRAGLSGYVAR